jgi:adenylylsulfate reductase subunit B
MPTYVNPNKCDGCKALDRPACEYICPSDIMTLNHSIGKAFNREPDMCWECYSCVKTCPQSAIDMRGYNDVVPLGASLTPMRGSDSIMWTVRFRDGQMKRFKYAIRTTAWGSIDPFKHADASPSGDLRSPALYGEAQYLGVGQLPVLQRSTTTN